MLRMIFASPDYLNLKEKMDLMEEWLGNDKSDLAENCRIGCMAALHDVDGKAATWAALIDPNSTDSLKESIAKMSGFYSRKQLDIL
jgi:hypothetical protein